MASGTQRVFAAVKSFGQRGRLLSERDLRALAESRGMGELVTRVRETRYAAAVAGLPAEPTSAAVESALRSALAEAHHSVVRTSGEPVLEEYYLRLIAGNLKLVLRGKAQGLPQEEIEPGVNLRAEELVRQRDVVLRALVAKDLEEAVAGLSGTIFGADAARAAALYGESGSLQSFDTFLDRVLAARLARALRSAKDGALAAMASMDVDFYNLLCIVRGRFWGLPSERARELAVSPTPAAPAALLDRMAAASGAGGALAELAGTRYGGLAEPGGGGAAEVAAFERAFELRMYRAAAHSFRRMFSAGTSLGIMKLAAYEVRNLSAIAYAVEQGIPAEATMKKLTVDRP